MRLTPIATTLLIATTASAQSWVTFTEQTSTRLQLQSLAAGGAGVGLGDQQEKDLIADDFDKDGDEDLVIVRKLPFSNPGPRKNILLMSENGVLVDRTGTLAPDLLSPDDTRDILVVDVNNDTWPDLVTATTFNDIPKVWVNQAEDLLGVWQGFALDATAIQASDFAQGPMFCAVYEGDINNDGWMDLYFSDYDSTLEDQLLVNQGEIGGVWQGYDNETSARIASGLNDSVFGTGSFLCDMNYDGWIDILKVSGMFQPTELLINDQTGNFNHSQIITNTGFGGDAVYMARVGDYDNDGRTDIYFVDDSDDFVLYNDSTIGSAATGGGQLSTTRVNITGSNRTDGFGGNVKTMDVDRDGCLDVAVADVDVDIANCNNPNAFAILRNDFLRTGSRGFTDTDPGTNYAWNTNSTHDFEFLDIDGDGFLDVVIATCTTYKVFMQDPFAIVETYGDACSGTLGLPEIGSLGGAPTIGNGSFALTLMNIPVGAPTALLIGTERAQIPFLGCDINVGLTNLFSVPTGNSNAMGGVQTPIPIPNNLSLEGTRSFLQYITIDLGGTLNGEGTLTEGLEVYISENFVM